MSLERLETQDRDAALDAFARRICEAGPGLDVRRVKAMAAELWSAWDRVERPPSTEVAGLRRQRDDLIQANNRYQDRYRAAEASLAVVRQSLKDQARARADAAMPLLTATVVKQLRSDAEAQYAMAETREERVTAHGLDLLCDWQDRARAAAVQRDTRPKAATQ